MLKMKRIFTPILMGMLITLIFAGQAAAEGPDSSWPNSFYDQNDNDRNGLDLNPSCGFLDRQPDGSCLKFSNLYPSNSDSSSTSFVDFDVSTGYIKIYDKNGNEYYIEIEIGGKFNDNNILPQPDKVGVRIKIPLGGAR